MATESLELRKRADVERVAAEATNLPQRRDQHLRSAEAWDVMAEQIERTVFMAEVNATAKARGIGLT